MSFAGFALIKSLVPEMLGEQALAAVARMSDPNGSARSEPVEEKAPKVYAHTGAVDNLINHTIVAGATAQLERIESACGTKIDFASMLGGRDFGNPALISQAQDLGSHFSLTGRDSVTPIHMAANGNLRSSGFAMGAA
jgi:hypothetical protein